MKIVVASFYADIFGKPSRFDEFLPYILASKKALSLTNPEAKYIVLTDDTTCELFDKVDVQYQMVAPTHMPLMLKIIFAQRMFIRTCQADLIVLPDVDCIANKDLSRATPLDVGLGITRRSDKFEYRINNVAYIRDIELAGWFLERAYKILEGWSQEKKEWDGGDQEAWEAALEAPRHKDEWYAYEDIGDHVFVSRPEGRDVHIYPCDSHNCFIPDGGNFQPKHFNAFMVHFKGDRKKHLGKWMRLRFGK